MWTFTKSHVQPEPSHSPTVTHRKPHTPSGPSPSHPPCLCVCTHTRAPVRGGVHARAFTLHMRSSRHVSSPAAWRTRALGWAAPARPGGSNWVCTIGGHPTWHGEGPLERTPHFNSPTQTGDRQCRGRKDMWVFEPGKEKPPSPQTPSVGPPGRPTALTQTHSRGWGPSGPLA